MAAKTLEYMAPRRASTNTLAVALIYRAGDEVFLGLEDRDLPAPQSFTGHSDLLTVPAWRIPTQLTTLSEAKEWVKERLQAEHGVIVGESWELGGPFHPTPGLTPESVHPLAAEVRGVEVDSQCLHWLRLSELLHHRSALRDGQLRILAYRLAHALGVGWV